LAVNEQNITKRGEVAALSKMNVLNKAKYALLALCMAAMSSVASATPTPVDAAADIEAAAGTATTVFNAFATLSIAAFVLAMVFAFAKRGRR
jgi:hypothetical protein